MDARQRVWPLLAAGASLAVGFVLVLNDSGAGWFLIIMGTIYIGALTRPGQGWAAPSRGPVQWGLVAVAVLTVLLAVVVGAALLLS